MWKPCCTPSAYRLLLKGVGILALVLLVGVMAGAFAAQVQEGAVVIDEGPAPVEEICPPRVGIFQRPHPHADALEMIHAGKKIYFCCDRCQAPFEKNPAKYLNN